MKRDFLPGEFVTVGKTGGFGSEMTSTVIRVAETLERFRPWAHGPLREVRICNSSVRILQDGTG